MEVLIGVDPHKAAHAVAAVDQRGELLEHASFGAGRSGLRSLMLWAKRFPKRHWAVEGANGMGHLALPRFHGRFSIKPRLHLPV